MKMYWLNLNNRNFPRKQCDPSIPMNLNKYFSKCKCGQEQEMFTRNTMVFVEIRQKMFNFHLPIKKPVHFNRRSITVNVWDITVMTHIISLLFDSIVLLCNFSLMQANWIEPETNASKYENILNDMALRVNIDTRRIQYESIDLNNNTMYAQNIS